jgi:predicted metalloprotease with PDZ domain
VEHPYLGVQMVQLTPEVKQQLADSPMADNWTVPDDSGVLLVRVMRDSPAAAAGLRSGDVLKSVGGKNVTDPDAVQEIVANTQIGDNLPVEISREGQKINLNIQVGSLNTANRFLVWKISGKRPKLYRELTNKLSIFLVLLLALESNNYAVIVFPVVTVGREKSEAIRAK